MRRVVIVGPGAAGKSTLAGRLSKITGLPVVELDKLFWQPGLVPTPPDQWAAIERELADRQSWIMDGDLGPYDISGVRFQAADTVVFLDFSPIRCTWRAIRRSRERADFWLWVWTYRRRSRPLVRRLIAEHARNADLHVLSTPRAVRRFLAQVDQEVWHGARTKLSSGGTGAAGHPLREVPRWQWPDEAGDKT
jgi:adenylate kinase family enzyme